MKTQTGSPPCHVASRLAEPQKPSLRSVQKSPRSDACQTNAGGLHGVFPHECACSCQRPVNHPGPHQPGAQLAQTGFVRCSRGPGPWGPGQWDRPRPLQRRRQPRSAPRRRCSRPRRPAAQSRQDCPSPRRRCARPRRVAAQPRGGPARGTSRGRSIAGGRSATGSTATLCQPSARCRPAAVGSPGPGHGVGSAAAARHEVTSPHLDLT
jgi:hypothetical protein